MVARYLELEVFPEVFLPVIFDIDPPFNCFVHILIKNIKIFLASDIMKLIKVEINIVEGRIFFGNDSVDFILNT